MGTEARSVHFSQRALLAGSGTSSGLPSRCVIDSHPIAKRLNIFLLLKPRRVQTIKPRRSSSRRLRYSVLRPLSPNCRAYVSVRASVPLFPPRHCDARRTRTFNAACGSVLPASLVSTEHGMRAKCSLRRVLFLRLMARSAQLRETMTAARPCTTGIVPIPRSGRQTGPRLRPGSAELGSFHRLDRRRTSSHDAAATRRSKRLPCRLSRRQSCVPTQRRLAVRAVSYRDPLQPRRAEFPAPRSVAVTYRYRTSSQFAIRPPIVEQPEPQAPHVGSNASRVTHSDP